MLLVTEGSVNYQALQVNFAVKHGSKMLKVTFVGSLLQFLLNYKSEIS